MDHNVHYTTSLVFSGTGITVEHSASLFDNLGLGMEQELQLQPGNVPNEGRKRNLNVEVHFSKYFHPKADNNTIPATLTCGKNTLTNYSIVRGYPLPIRLCQKNRVNFVCVCVCVD